MDVIKEFTLQKGRRMMFKSNENNRCKAICKWKKDLGCPWVVFAFKDVKDTCWKVKTFKNIHICEKTKRNRCANRKWLAPKLVRKLRHYPNLKYGEALAYFKRKCALKVPMQSLSMALSDARSKCRDSTKNV
ncbi:hypothetical protein PIB30_085957 [Stylosanthes scabra]|uniref:Transposase MuDR plant domain-containing protein n=1 Tax=Stylosanthes scabra TaxID=79078 RepID=A0ABU6STP8_9FABA|nr:hypothetical protein [Stylosanthes scabra]